MYKGIRRGGVVITNVCVVPLSFQTQVTSDKHDKDAIVKHKQTHLSLQSTWVAVFVDIFRCFKPGNAVN